MPILPLLPISSSSWKPRVPKIQGTEWPVSSEYNFEHGRYLFLRKSRLMSWTNEVPWLKLLQWFSCAFQWRIQDLPEEGAPTPQEAPTYDFAKNSQNLHAINRIWTTGGGARPLCPPRSAFVCKMLKSHASQKQIRPFFNVSFVYLVELYKYLPSKYSMFLIHLGLTINLPPSPPVLYRLG